MTAEPALEDRLRHLLEADAWRLAVMRTVRAARLPDCWIGAGFVRALVWDHLHDFTAATPLDDVDVIFFDPENHSKEHEQAIEADLSGRWPGGLDPVPWQARNQARMHAGHGDRPYRDCADALIYWLETPTAVAVRLHDGDRIEILAPIGLTDLFDLRVAPTLDGGRRRPDAYRKRIETKRWEQFWPRLNLILPDGEAAVDGA
jgi:hypothetical protein